MLSGKSVYTCVSGRQVKTLTRLVSWLNQGFSRNLHTSNEKEQNKPRCNYRIKSVCPLEGKCLAANILCLAETWVENRNNVIEGKLHIGVTENEWKTIWS